jgi:uncharacterized protein
MGASTVEVGRSVIGHGVFAAQPFEPGQPILLLNGPILDYAEVLAMGGAGAYAMQIGPGEYMDLTSPGRFANHSCDPNSGIKNDRVLIALRRIGVGEEIRFDYSTAMSGDHWTMECRCGEPFCRRVILDFHHLPPIGQNRYLQLGVVQRFIVDQARRRSPAPRVARRSHPVHQISL